MSTRTQSKPQNSGAGPKALTLPAVVASQCIFVVIAWLLNIFALRRPLLMILSGGASLPVQLLVGAAVAAVLAAAVSYPILTSPGLRNVRTLMQQMAAILVSNVLFIFIASLLAGVGEEVLFRGTLQPWLGLWWASLLFVLVHLPHILTRPLGLGSVSYLLFVFGMALVLGYLFTHFGLVSAVTAHAIFDLGLLFAFRQYAR